jgi:hypothetical protein
MAVTETVVRVQWGDGRITEVSDGGVGRRRAIAVAANDVTTLDAAVARGEAVLATLGTRESVTAQLEDADDWPQLRARFTVPGFDGSPQVQRLVSRRVSWDRNGFAAITPTFQTPEEQLEQRNKIALERMATGLVGGRNAGVQPLRQSELGIPHGVLRSVRIPAFTKAPLATATGPDWKADTTTIVTKTQFLLTPSAATDDDIDVVINVDGTPVVALQLPQGNWARSFLGNLLIPAGAVLRPDIDIGSNDPADLEDHKLTIQFDAAPASLRLER